MWIWTTLQAIVWGTLQVGQDHLGLDLEGFEVSNGEENVRRY